MTQNKIVMRHLVQALETDNDLASSYYCLSTNSFETIDHVVRRWIGDALDVKDAPEWMQDQIKVAMAIEEMGNKDYYALPNIDEEAIKERFVHRINDVSVARDVMDTLKSRSGYRHFIKIIKDQNLLDHWYGFRRQCYKEMAIEWCEKYGFTYVED